MNTEIQIKGVHVLLLPRHPIRSKSLRCGICGRGSVFFPGRTRLLKVLTQTINHGSQSEVLAVTRNSKCRALIMTGLFSVSNPPLINTISKHVLFTPRHAIQRGGAFAADKGCTTGCTSYHRQSCNDLLHVNLDSFIVSICTLGFQQSLKPCYQNQNQQAITK